MKRRVALLLCAALCLGGAAALAQTTDAQSDGPATLIADRVEIVEDGRLIATGNVEALFKGTRLTAGQIAYDPDTEALVIEGPIRITQPDGSVLLASSAELTTDLRDGLLRSARLVMDQRLQLAAAQIDRAEGRYTQLTRTVTSSCEVCAARPVPLWRIRADKVVHDSVEQQLYFSNAWFEVAGIPVFWLPRLRLPDPTLERASGFLTPSLRSTDELGFGFKLPYFIKLGDHKDLTLTPYLANSRTQTLEARYRQAFRTGDIELNGAVSVDDILPDQVRSYMFAVGDFDLPFGYKLSFDLKTTTDNAYLLDYDYSGQDRLASDVTITRVDRDEFIGIQLVGYRSLRSSEDNRFQPFLVTDTRWVRRFSPVGLGGIARLEFETHAHRRNSDLDVLGRDVGRVSGLANWTRTWVDGNTGLVLEALAQVRLDHTQVGQDSRFSEGVTEITPSAGLTLSWPHVRHGTSATHLLEPIAQILWTRPSSEKLPIDESTQLELDEGNLFGLSRFPASDVLERGVRGNFGISYTRTDHAGWALGATVGRVLRYDDLEQFAGYEILEGDASDWLVGVRLDLPDNLSVSTRALFDEEFFPTRNDLRLDWRTEDYEVAGSYTWLRASPAEMRLNDTNEWRLNGNWQVNDRWKVASDWRYDLKLDRSASAEIGLEYRTECAVFDFSVRRRFTSSVDLRPTTDFGFQIGLDGFGTSSDSRARPSRPGCRR